MDREVALFAAAPGRTLAGLDRRRDHRSQLLRFIEFPRGFVALDDTGYDSQSQPENRFPTLFARDAELRKEFGFRLCAFGFASVRANRSSGVEQLVRNALRRAASRPERFA